MQRWRALIQSQLLSRTDRADRVDARTVWSEDTGVRTTCFVLSLTLALLSACEPESTFPQGSHTNNVFDNVDLDTGDEDDNNGGDNGGNNGGDNGGNNGGNNGGDNGGNSGGDLSGGDLYVQNCKSCHGKDGEGSSSAPQLAGEINTLTDSELTDIIMNGTGTMPAPGLSESEAQTLVDWLRNAWQ